MKAPYFELQADGEAQIVSKLLLADTRPVKLERRRALKGTSNMFTVSDSNTRKCFSEGNDSYKNAYTKRKYAKNTVLYFVLFPAVFIALTVIFAVIIFLGKLQTAMTEIPAVIIMLLLCLVLSGAAAVVLAAWRIYKGKYLKRVFYLLDEVYILFGKSGAPCCICVEDNGVKVLYGEKLYRADGSGTGLITDEPKNIYLEYLNMYPQSALDMGAFVKDRKKYFLTADTGCEKNATAVFCENSHGASLSVNAIKTNVSVWKLHKILFDLDENLNLAAVYSIAGMGWAEYITLANVTSCGEEVLEELNKISEKYPALGGLLKEIL